MTNQYEPWIELGITELEYWKKLHIESQEREKILQKGCEDLAELDCACESGTHYTPEFICGSHKCLLSLFEEKK